MTRSLPRRLRTASRSVRLALAAGLVLTIAACGGGAAAPTGAPATTAPSAGGGSGAGTVSIKDFAYGPASITVPAGTTVTWTNADTAGHTVTADDGSFDSKTMANGATFSQAFTTAGTFSYHCAIHTTMTGTVVVN